MNFNVSTFNRERPCLCALIFLPAFWVFSTAKLQSEEIYLVL